LDSAQIYFEIPKESRVLVDLGSGGGFPAVVIAILNKVLNGSLEKIVLIESDNKKAVFLKEVSRILELNLTVLNDRIENINGLVADVITSRALGKIQLLLDLSKNFNKKDTLFLLLKGEKVDLELSEVGYRFKSEKKQSKISNTGCILKISEVDYL
jgi:16S rRNA (guanine527-N7)-methyltransferase